MKYTDENLREELKAVIDPEVGMNIVDMGLVYNIDITEEHIIVYMTLTTQGCPMGDYITGHVKHVLDALPGAPPVREVALVWDPPWSPSMMKGFNYA